MNVQWLICEASFDGWTAQCRFEMRGDEFIIETNSFEVVKQTWAWLTGPVTIEKCIGNIEAGESIAIKVRSPLGSSVSFVGFIKTSQWLFSDRSALGRVQIQGYVQGGPREVKIEIK